MKNANTVDRNQLSSAGLLPELRLVRRRRHRRERVRRRRRNAAALPQRPTPGRPEQQQLGAGGGDARDRRRLRRRLQRCPDVSAGEPTGEQRIFQPELVGDVEDTEEVPMAEVGVGEIVGVRSGGAGRRRFLRLQGCEEDAGATGPDAIERAAGSLRIEVHKQDDVGERGVIGALEKSRGQVRRPC